MVALLDLAGTSILGVCKVPEVIFGLGFAIPNLQRQAVDGLLGQAQFRHMGKILGTWSPLPSLAGTSILGGFKVPKIIFDLVFAILNLQRSPALTVHRAKGGSPSLDNLGQTSVGMVTIGGFS